MSSLLSGAMGRLLFGNGRSYTLGAKVANISTVTTSRKCYLRELGTDVSLSIDAGEISLNGGSFGAGPVVASDGDYIQIKVTSSGDYETPVVVTVSGTGYSDTFTVTTVAEAGDYAFQDGALITFQDGTVYFFN